MAHEGQRPHDSPASRYYELVDRGDLEGVLALFSPDAVYDRPGHGRIQGADALRHFFLHERKLVSSRHDIRRFITDGDWVVAEGVAEARTEDGDEVKVAFVDVFRIEGDLIVERRGYVSR